MTTSGVANTSASGATNSNSTASQTSSLNDLANENTFLQLFVAQLKTQDPLNPAAGTQFVTQLAQFSELEQVIGINQNVGAIRSQFSAASNTDSSATNTQSVT